MKHLALYLSLLISPLLMLGEETKQQYFMLSGASFAIPENTWFEMGCEAFNARSINKAVSGQAITHTAVDMFNDKFYTLEELDKTDVFVIMHVHNRAVANEQTLKENYKDYTEAELTSDYAAAYDYVIKRYKSDCNALKDNVASKFYGTESGKPAVIVLTTHWHDARTIFNADVRKLALKWNLPLVKFDDNIGFTKDELENGKQPSLQYASDTQTHDGQTYGFHPIRGRNQYIQQKIAQIFVKEMEALLGKIPPTAILREKSMSLLSGEDAYVSFYFLGEKPWNLVYSVNGQSVVKNDITENPLLVKIDVTENKESKVVPVSVTNSSGTEGKVFGESVIQYAIKTTAPVYDAYIHQKSAAISYETGSYVQVKGLLGNYSREAFFSFQLSDVSDVDGRIIFRTYFYKNVYPGDVVVSENHIVEISGNSETYSGLTWNTKPEKMDVISESIVSPSDLNSYISWDVTDWVKQQKQLGKEIGTLRLRIVDYTTGLLHFYTSESKVSPPQLLVTPKSTIGLNDNQAGETRSYYSPLDQQVYINSTSAIGKVSVFSTDGKCYQIHNDIDSSNYAFDVSLFPKGVYLLLLQNDSQRDTQKIMKSN